MRRLLVVRRSEPQPLVMPLPIMGHVVCTVPAEDLRNRAHMLVICWQVTQNHPLSGESADRRRFSRTSPSCSTNR